MSQTQRVVFLVIAAVIVLGTLVVFGFGGDSNDDSASSVTALPAATVPAKTATVTQTTKPAPAKPPLLKAGSERTLTVTKGDTVRFRVVNPAAEEVHVHGYDFTYDLEPGVTKTISFPAKIEGQFEIELEQSATPLAKLVVNPR